MFFLDLNGHEVQKQNVENSHVESQVKSNQFSLSKLDVSNLEEVQVSCKQNTMPNKSLLE